MRRTLLVPSIVACGLAVTAPSATAIVGGSDAKPGEHPYAANVEIANAASCSGSLIAATWVMTAGHCASATGATGIPTPMKLPPSAFTVTVGTVDADGSGGETHAVKSVHVDPNYAATNGTASDVALLELVRPSQVIPVKIAANSERSIWEPGDELTIAGFGLTREDGNAPDTLQVAQVPRVSDADCAQAYDDATPVAGDAFDPKTALCAGVPQGGRDTCQGDSGGPLLAPLGDGFRLVGATSYGEGCGREGRPGVYARVAEGSVKTFVSGLVPGAYASEDGSTPVPASKPAPPGTPANCAGKPGLTVLVRPPANAALRRARVSVGAKTVVNRRGRALRAFRVRLARRLPRSGTTKVKVVTLSSNGVRRRTTFTYSDCTKASSRTQVKRRR